MEQPAPVQEELLAALVEASWRVPDNAWHNYAYLGAPEGPALLHPGLSGRLAVSEQALVALIDAGYLAALHDSRSRDLLAVALTPRAVARYCETRAARRA